MWQSGKKQMCLNLRWLHHVSAEGPLVFLWPVFSSPTECRETWVPVYRYLRKGGVPMKCNHLNFEWGTLQWITAMNVASEWILEWLLRVIERKRKTLGSIFIRLCDTFLHVDSLPHSRIPLAGIQKLTRMCGKEIVLHRQTYGNQETWFLFSQPQIHEITQSWLSVT